MKKAIGVFAVGVIVLAVARMVSMCAPSPRYKMASGATVTTTVRLLPPSQWGLYEMQACGRKGGTHCSTIGFVKRCVSTYYP